MKIDLKGHLIFFVAGFVFLPILITVFIFVPLLGQCLGFLNLAATLFYFHFKGYRYLSSSVLGGAAFMLLVFLWGRELPMVFQLVGGFGLMFGLPLSVVYLIVIGCLAYRQLELREVEHSNSQKSRLSQ